MAPSSRSETARKTSRKSSAFDGKGRYSVPAATPARLAYRRSYCRGMAALIREGIDAGTIPPQDTELAAAAVVGVIAETLVGPLSPVATDTGSEEQIVRAIVGFCRRVIGLRTTS